MNIAKALDFFIPAARTLHAEEKRKARLFVGITVYGVIFVTVSIAVRLATEGLSLATLAVMFSDVALLATYFYYRHTRNVAVSSDSLIVIILFSINLIAWNDNGLFSRSMTWLATIPIIANFLGDKIRAISALVLVSINLVLLVVLQHLLIIPTELHSDSLEGRAFAFFASTFLVSILAKLYDQTRREIEKDYTRLHEMQKQWVAVVSHELNTPLSALHSSMALIKNSLKQKTSVDHAMIDIAFRNASRLSRLVGDISEADKLSWQNLKLRQESSDLAQLTRECIYSVNSLSANKHVSIVYKGSDQVFGEFDPDRLSQVIFNLLENAIKFSPDNGAVIVAITESKADVTLCVTDQGPGVPEDFRKHLFEPFTQAEMSDARVHEGSGLGLYICRSIVHLHEGKISVQNREQGGACFCVTLPRRFMRE